ncbi:hypothetical protein ES705_28953 [subsurface metagenome]
MTGELGAIDVGDIAQILDVYGITSNPKRVCVLTDPTPENPIGNDFWRFNRTEGKLYLPLDAIINFEKFNFTMVLWEDLTQDIGDKNVFDVDGPISLDNITIIENVIRDNGGEIEYFTKNFETDYSFYQDEPYFIELNADGSVDYINLLDSYKIWIHV